MMIVFINTLLTVWLTGAAFSFVIVLLGSHSIIAEDGHTVKGFEHFIVNLMLILFWPRYMWPALIGRPRK